MGLSADNALPFSAGTVAAGAFAFGTGMTSIFSSGGALGSPPATGLSATVVDPDNPDDSGDPVAGSRCFIGDGPQPSTTGFFPVSAGASRNVFNGAASAGDSDGAAVGAGVAEGAVGFADGSGAMAVAGTTPPAAVAARGAATVPVAEGDVGIGLPHGSSGTRSTTVRGERTVYA